MLVQYLLTVTYFSPEKSGNLEEKDVQFAAWLKLLSQQFFSLSNHIIPINQINFYPG